MIRQLRPIISVLLLSAVVASADPPSDSDYIERFRKEFPRKRNAEGQDHTLDQIASVELYDARFMGTQLDRELEAANLKGSNIAWGWSYRMMSLNDMFRVTGDAKYLEAHLEIIRRVQAVRDDRTGLELWTGEVKPAWSSDRYAERGQALFAVHTGMILYPMAELVLLAREVPEFSDRNGEELKRLTAEIALSLSAHDVQWRDGPGEGEGHYVGLNQENVCEGKPLPGNRIAAMGRALWRTHEVTGNELYRDRALRIGRYIRNRLSVTADGAAMWPYWLPEETPSDLAWPAKNRSEDISHAALTAALPIMLAEAGEVFSRDDMEKIGLTVTRGFGRLGGGILFGEISGRPDSNPAMARSSSRWLRMTPFAPEAATVVSDFYRFYQPNPSALDMALLLKSAASGR